MKTIRSLKSRALVGIALGAVLFTGCSSGLTPEAALNKLDSLSQQVICGTDNGKAVSDLESYVSVDNLKAGSSSSYAEKLAALRVACDKLAKTNPDVKAAVKTLRARQAEWRQEDIKFKPLLENYNPKAQLLGGGNYVQYISAKRDATEAIKSGAKNQFTGADKEVQNANCEATIRSTWKYGFPGGWWRCEIDFLGASTEIYSIEFSNDGWSGKLDSGYEAGREVVFDTPKGFDAWIERTNQ